MNGSANGGCRAPVTLAPMEEHTNFPFRLLMKRFGAGLVCTERIDAVDVAGRDRRAMRMLHTTTEERPRAAQISGADPEVMASAARVIEEQGFDLVDLNFECPIRRVIARGEGGALMADPAAVDGLSRPWRRAVSIGVTVKLRTGPDAEHETVIEIAQRGPGRRRGRHLKSTRAAWRSPTSADPTGRSSRG